MGKSKGRRRKDRGGGARRNGGVVTSQSSMGGLFAALGVAVFVAMHYASKYLPPPKPKIIGIDLGTTYSCVGVYQAGTGEVKILADAAGRRTIPSVVGFMPEGTPLVGHAAKQQAASNPLNTIHEAKRFMGKPYSSISSADIARFPFTIREAPTGNRGRGGVELEVINNRKPARFSPEEIGGVIIKELHRTAELALGSKIKQAVLAVPTEFSAAQRNATIRAGELAGLEVLRLLTEPTAAAMAYGLHTKADVDYIVVFDFGGGTLDVSLLEVQRGMYITYAVAGNKYLGGEDLSHRLFEYALKAYKKEFGTTMSSPTNRQRLRNAVEQAKIAVSADVSTVMSIALEQEDGESGGEGGGEGGEGGLFELTVTRALFEAVNQDLFDKVMAPLYRVLQEGGVDKGQVDEVVLVGGSTRIPKVRKMLTEFLGKPPCMTIDPDEAVAVGVAMQAGILAGAWPLQVSVLEAPWTGESIEME